ncbi:MAG: hypothetical protein H7Y04_10310 [Verrucomicrobia bacterium]|nr:hypothetical protein [Cytophagales bacterium]
MSESGFSGLKDKQDFKEMLQTLNPKLLNTNKGKKDKNFSTLLLPSPSGAGGF